MLAQLLGNRQHDVGGGGPDRNRPDELEADNLRDQHRYWLAEHSCLGFDSAHSPAQDAKAVDHGGVRVGAYTGVWVSLKFPVDFAGHNRSG